MSSSHGHWHSGKPSKGDPYSHSQSMEEDDDEDDSCGFICFALGVIFLFAGVAVLATVLVYSQSSDASTRVISLTSTRPVKYVSEQLLYAIENPNTMQTIDHAGDSSASNLLLLIIVRSLPNMAHRRNEIRNSWMKEVGSNLNALVRFAVPGRGVSEELEASLYDESRLYKDMVVFKDCRDLPESEGLLYEMIWANKKYNFLYLMKARDTVYIRVPELVQEVVHKLEEVKSNAYLGYFEGKGDPKSSEKLAEPDWFLCDHYIRFAHSGGYIISHILVQRLLLQAEFLHPYNNEDVAVGTWLSPYKDIDWSHSVQFDTNIGTPRGCKNNLLVFQPGEGKMAETHQRLSNGGWLCQREFQDVQTYTYNFETLPSKCCTAL